MSAIDIFAVLHWWVVILIIGLGFLPLTAIIFSRFFDNGYIFSKLFGIAIASYAVFLLGISKLVPFSQINGIVISISAAALVFYLIPIKWRVFYLIKKGWKIFVLEEVIFLGALFSWSFIHGFNPDIHGLEKYMDYGFINSILRSEYFPPKDMWFTPEPINYYYYGHFITAFLTKISNIPSPITFNLMLSTIFAFCAAQTFSIGSNLYYMTRGKLSAGKLKVKLVIAGLLTAMLTSLGGNLHIIYAFFAPYDVEKPKPFWELPFLPSTFPNSYWYPNATRFIYNTIHEFPIYSWVVADLHGHVLDIPFVLLIIALLLSLFIKSDPSAEEEITDEKWKRSWLMNRRFLKFKSFFYIHPLMIFLIGFLLAVMYMTNAWDGAIYLLLTTFVIIFLLVENHAGFLQPTTESKIKPKTSNSPLYMTLLLIIAKLIVPVLLIGITFFIFTFPYNSYFEPFAEGIGVLCAPEILTNLEKFGPFVFQKDHCQRSYWWELLILYGYFYFFAFSFLIYLTFTKKILRIDLFIVLLIIMSTFLIFLPEFIYVKDIYPAHFRANTMFKLVFQAFIMLSISSIYILNRVAKSRTRFVFLPMAFTLIAFVMTYPYLAIGSYYGDIADPSKYKGLHGTTYLHSLYQNDYAAILWINAYIEGQPVILEAQGDSYTDYARVSANTGLPTVLGWTVHEWLWRGDYGIPAPRITEVTNIYETSDVELARELLSKHDVKYVFIGHLEYEKYPKLNERKFEQLGRIIYQNGRTKIYEIL
jgi:YYY domain-containing protein